MSELRKNDWVNNNPNPPIDMTGKKINMLTVLYRSENLKGRTRWHCRCDCGKELDVDYGSLKKGQYSCGCFTSARIREKKSTHGKSDTRLFNVWAKMKERCCRKTHKSYIDYGGRGIKVCPEWLNDFSAFDEWAMANGYDENADFMKCTLDRIDPNGDYEPSNCRFVSMKVQCNNRRNNHYILYKGEKHTIAEWSDITGLSFDTIYRRLKLGWNDGQALGFEKRKGCRVKSKYESFEQYLLEKEGRIA